MSNPLLSTSLEQLVGILDAKKKLKNLVEPRHDSVASKNGQILSKASHID